MDEKPFYFISLKNLFMMNELWLASSFKPWHFDMTVRRYIYGSTSLSTATCMSAMCKCSCGSSSSTFMAVPIHQTLTTNKPAANIQDHIPFLNIMPFGMCDSLLNPVVAAATAEKLGILQPMPCIPMTTSPWLVGAPTVILQNQPMLDKNSTLMCNWAGVIKIQMPGEFTVKIP